MKTKIKFSIQTFKIAAIVLLAFGLLSFAF